MIPGDSRSIEGVKEILTIQQFYMLSKINGDLRECENVRIRNKVPKPRKIRVAGSC